MAEGLKDYAMTEKGIPGAASPQWRPRPTFGPRAKVSDEGLEILPKGMIID